MGALRRFDTSYPLNPDFQTRRSRKAQSKVTLRAARCVVLLSGLFFLPSAIRAADAAGGLASRPLNPPSGPRGKTMFVELAPEVTGVQTENRYDDPRMFGDLFQEFEAGSVGT